MAQGNRADDQELQSNMSPGGSDLVNSTPNTEFSPPSSPPQKSQILKDTRISARKKLAQLTLQEKVISAFSLWNMPYLPSDGLLMHFAGVPSHSC